MKNLLKLFLMSFIITIPTMAWSTDLYVSGRITNTDNEPITGATIMVPNTPQGTTSDINGEFKYTFRNVDDPANVKLKISYLGYQTQDITPGTDQNIILVENLIPVDDAVVTVCGSRPAEGRKTQALKDPEKPDQGCYPTACYDEFTLNGTGIDALCVARNCHENNGSGKYAYDENTKGYAVRDLCALLFHYEIYLLNLYGLFILYVLNRIVNLFTDFSWFSTKNCHVLWLFPQTKQLFLRRQQIYPFREQKIGARGLQFFCFILLVQPTFS